MDTPLHTPMTESHELPDSGIPYLYTIANAPGTGNIYTQPALGRITTASGQTRRNGEGRSAVDPTITEAP